MKGIIGKKVGMTQVYAENGAVIPVTVLQAGPCVVVDVKTQESNGYSALQLGFGARKVKNVTKPLLGHYKRSGADSNPPAVVREIRMEQDPEVELGSEVKADVFNADEFLDVTGVTKGRGFQGVVPYNSRQRGKRCKQEKKEKKQRQGRQKKRIRREACLLYTSPSPRDRQKSRMPSSA
eukprot:TRINITY_DN2422_c0_g2_i14.p2 TRINITY_DN2422_c0_g2~~TRINITY_DN2422_c0_g2_i14.p2  ORF type:complete len:179 (-),score=25.26 TRINITY_DN2422_c0_g2_i14:60-596(-)